MKNVFIKSICNSRHFLRIAFLFAFSLSSVIAYAQQSQYTVDTYIWDMDHCSSVDITYENDGSVTLTPNLVEGWEIEKWDDDDSGDILGTGNTLNFTPVSDITVGVYVRSAQPSIQTNTVSIIINPSQGGKITYLGNDYFSTGSAIEFEIEQGLPVSLDAVALGNYDFRGWMGDGITGLRENPSYNFTPTGNVNITAYFEYQPQDRTVTVESNNENTGTVTFTYNNNSYTTYDHVTERSAFTLVPTPAPNYTLDHWTLNGQEITITNNTIVLPDNSEDRTYRAFFVRQDNNAMVNLVNSNDAVATVWAENVNVQTHLVVLGTPVHFNYEITNNNYFFMGWKNNLTNQVESTENDYVVVANADLSYTALFEHKPYTINTYVNPQGAPASIIVNAPARDDQGKYPAGCSASFSYELTGQTYRFVNWTDGNVTETGDEYSLSNIRDDHNVYANFVRQWTFDANNGGIADAEVEFHTDAVNHDGFYDEGSSFTVELIQTPEGKDFKCWVVNGQEVAEATNPEAFVVSLTNNTVVTPSFNDMYTLTLRNSLNAQDIAVSGAGSYVAGTSIEVSTSTNNSTYHFDGWYNGDQQLTDENTPSFNYTLNENTTLTAVYSNVALNYDLTVSVQGDGYVTRGTSEISGTTSIRQDTRVILVPHKGDGSRFMKWIVNGTDVAGDPNNDNSLDFYMSQNTNVVAVFAENSFYNVTIAMHPFDGVGVVEPCNNVCEVEAGSTLNLEATTLTEGYEFWGWIINNELVGRKYQNTLTLTNVNEDITLHVWFAPMNDEGSLNLLTYNEDSTVVTGIVQAYRNHVTSIVIPDNPRHIVQAIDDNAFQGCTSLESIYLQPTITSVGNHAFAQCPALTAIDLSSVTELGNGVFDGCSSLREVTLSDQLANLPEETFRNCSALQSINLPATVNAIGHRAFNGSNLYFINLPAALTTVGNQAFMGNANLRVVSINGPVESFGEDAFRGCTAISRTDFNGEFADWFGIEFANAYANPAARSRNLVINNVAISKVVVPEGVTDIKAFAFFNNNLIDSIVLSTSVQAIDSNAFYRNVNLKRIIINGNPNAIEVHEFAFENVNKDNVVVEVPCQYLPMAEWNGFTRIVGLGMPVLTLVQHPGGIVRFAEGDGIPACGSQEYTYHVVAQPSSKYSFISWSDGVVSTSRYITISEDKTLSAIFERKEILAISDTTYTFESTNAAMDWFSINNGDNEWVVDDAVARLGNKSLYVTKDNGATCSYFASNSPYAYTEIKLHNGLYRFSFNYKVGDVDLDKLSVALIPIEAGEEEDAYLHLDEVNPEGLPLYIGNLSNLYDENSWSDAYRLIDFGNEPEKDNQWYRLVFFWNVTSESNDDVADFAAAIDNVSFDWMDVKPSELNNLTTIVEAYSDDAEMGNAYVWNSQAPYTYTIPGTTVVVPIDEDVVKNNHRFTNLHINDEIWITAEPIDEHYRFVRWSDGNTQAHRQLDFKAIYGLNPVYYAYFEPVVETPHIYAEVESGAEDKGTAAIAFLNEIEVEQNIMRNMIEFVSDTTIVPDATYTFVLNLPQEKYAFMGWANANGDTLSKANPFELHYGQMSDKLDWSRDIHIFALMNELTPCSYDDNDFFSRNMPFGQFNFRGHDLDDVTVSNVEVSVRNGQIIVSEAAGIEVSLYDVNGRLLESKVENSQNIYFEVPTSGTYMLKVGDLLTRRVVVVR